MYVVSCSFGAESVLVVRPVFCLRSEVRTVFAATNAERRVDNAGLVGRNLRGLVVRRECPVLELRAAVYKCRKLRNKQWLCRPDIRVWMWGGTMDGEENWVMRQHHTHLWVVYHESPVHCAQVSQRSHISGLFLKVQSLRMVFISFRPFTMFKVQRGYDKITTWSGRGVAIASACARSQETKGHASTL
jgi:hypothetical protein